MKKIHLDDEPKHIDGISCNVNNCVYNHQEGHQCTAQAIHVGPSYAETGTQTLCGTFRNKDR